MSMAHDNLDDSDETFYCPDDKDAGENSRLLDLDSLSENDEDFYERAYNRYGLGLGPLGPRSSYREPDSEETFFDLADHALGLADGLDVGLLPESAETFYEPAEYGNRSVRPQDPASDGGGRAEGGAPSALQDYMEPRGGLGGQVTFPHDLQWAPACSPFAQDGGPDVAAAAEPACSPYDLYVEMPDPVTQEMQVYRVPGYQIGPDTLRLLSQDVYWTQTQTVAAQPVEECGPHDPGLQVDPDSLDAPLLPTGEVHGLGQEGDPGRRADAAASALDTFGIDTQDLEWTQTQGVRMDAAALDSTRIDTQDLEWTQTQAVAMDGVVPQHQVITEAAQTASSGHSMDLGSASPSGPQDQGAAAAVETGRRQAPQPVVGSSGSSEGQPLPSIPSFDDDLALPPAPLWPLLPEEQFKMEEIVTSLRCMSFNLDPEHGAVVAPSVDVAVGGVSPQGPQGPDGPASAAPCSSTSQQASQRRSPCLGLGTAAARRRRRRGRPRGSGHNDSGSGAGALYPGGSGSKRKRPVGIPLTRSGSFGPAPGSCSEQRASTSQAGCSPSPSSPRRKARRTFGPSASPSNSSVTRVEMIAVYSRLRELRFLMQDIIVSKEPLPTLEEVEKMQEEVLGIIANMEEAEPRRSTRRTNKTGTKRLEARQVADKLLDQLRVFAECHESQGNEDIQSDGAIQRSWSNVGEVPLPAVSTDSNAESKFCAPEKKIQGSSDTTQSIEKEITQKKSAKERSGKRKINKKKPTDCPKQESKESRSLTDVGCNWTHPSDDKKTEIDEQFGAVIVDETEEPSHVETVTETYLEIPQTEIFSGAVYSNTVCVEETKLNASLPSGSEDPSNSKSSMKESEQVREEIDHAQQAEYQGIVELIKSKAVITLTKTSANKTATQESFGPCEISPFTLTGILLPKRSELEPIHDFPLDSWGNPQAPIPEEWINMLEWED